jgi:hypothetical protein
VPIRSPGIPKDVDRWLRAAVDFEAERTFRALHSLRQPRPRYEPACTGLDPAFQGIGSSPYGDQSGMGLVWPFAPAHAPTEGHPLGVGPYLAVLDMFYVPSGMRKRLRGIRQLRTLRAITNPGSEDEAPRPTEIVVTTPNWHFPDQYFSWHLRELPDTLLQRIRPATGPFDTQNFAFRMSVANAAILYENASFNAFDLDARGKPDFYHLLTGYVPPNAGRPWGNPVGKWGTFYDLRAPWNDSHAWSSLDIEIAGPCTVALFASCLQTNFASRTPITLPGTLISTGIAPEEAFAVNWSTAIEGRVAGQLVVEDSV